MRSLLLILVAALLSAVAQAGVFGMGSFENDTALDWVEDCTQSSGTKEVEAALRAALRPGPLESEEALAAVAAAEVVAAALGKPSRSLPPELSKWIQRQPKQNLTQLGPIARQAVARVKDPKQSELRQAWSMGKLEQWLAGISELESRLGR